MSNLNRGQPSTKHQPFAIRRTLFISGDHMFWFTGLKFSVRGPIFGGTNIFTTPDPYRIQYGSMF